MFETLLITFREGIEALLIVFITLVYLRKTGASYLNSSVYAGIALAVLASIAGGYALESMDNPPLISGGLTIFAAILVMFFTIHISRVGKFMKKKIETGLQKHTDKGGLAARLGVFLFTLLMITREGMETMILVTSLIGTVDATEMLTGAAAGVILAAAVGILWVKYSHLINIGLFLQVTAVFLMVFSIQLLSYGLHELTEALIIANMQIPYIDIMFWHEATEDWAHDGMIAQILSYGLILMPLGWLAAAITRQKFMHPTATA